MWIWNQSWKLNSLCTGLCLTSNLFIHTSFQPLRWIVNPWYFSVLCPTPPMCRHQACTCKLMVSSLIPAGETLDKLWRTHLYIVSRSLTPSLWTPPRPPAIRNESPKRVQAWFLISTGKGSAANSVSQTILAKSAVSLAVFQLWVWIFITTCLPRIIPDSVDVNWVYILFTLPAKEPSSSC